MGLDKYYIISPLRLPRHLPLSRKRLSQVLISSAGYYIDRIAFLGLVAKINKEIAIIIIWIS
jgi:hypothetical protein